MVCRGVEVISNGLERRRDGKTDVVVRSSLASGEDGVVDSLLHVGLLVLSEEDETSSGTTKSLVAIGNAMSDFDLLVRGDGLTW